MSGYLVTIKLITPTLGSFSAGPAGLINSMGG